LALICFVFGWRMRPAADAMRTGSDGTGPDNFARTFFSCASAAGMMISFRVLRC
jgi:hypothetical protein